MNAHAGRYAPSPTGPLHLGSLLAGVGSYVHARAQGAPWYLRIDDLDATRRMARAGQQIVDTLAAFGLRWDADVVYQSRRATVYAQAVQWLSTAGDAFDCGCTRREARTGPAGLEGPIYPGTCRDGLAPGRQPRSVRLRVADVEVGCVDGVQGRYRQRMARDVGDFVIRRADGVTAYQLATVVDDAFQGVGEVVRGADLLASTPRQIYLQQRLGLPTPDYVHLPLVVDAEGQKLGKSTGALSLSYDNRAVQLCQCLSLLGQAPPGGLAEYPVERVLAWAIDNWALERVPKTAAVDAPPVPGVCYPGTAGWPRSAD